MKHTTPYRIFGSIMLMTLLITGCSSTNNKQNNITSETKDAVQIIPISHATAIIQWGETTIYTDPTGGAEAFANQKSPDIIVVTDIHGDHLNEETLNTVINTNSTLIVPNAVKDQLAQSLASRSTVLNNEEVWSDEGFTITAMPMYNLPESEDSRHTKGRGNGYIIEKDNFRVYIAGDTSDIPEMRNLSEIDIAFIPMNLPFTMSVDDAADAVLEFAPKKVYPYHYRGQDGLSDINRFKSLVNEGNPNIEVVLENWYPNGV